MKVLVGDPGSTTGWVYAALERTAEPSHEMVKRVKPIGGQIDGHGDELLNAWDFWMMARKLDVELIVLESFILFPDQQHHPDPAGLAPVRIIAMVEAYNWGWGQMDYDAVPYDISYQTPSEKSVITDERLRRWGLWTPGKIHQNDAMRHLIVFTRKWMD